jgi:hypothetical protein
MSRTKYNETFPTLAEKYAREGMIDREIAKKLGVSESSYHVYENKYPEFLESIKRGKVLPDDEAEKALFKRVIGFEYEEVMVEYAGRPKEAKKATPTLVRKTKKLVIPDVAACAIWLTNRRPEKWRHRHDVEFPAGLKITVISAVPRPEKPVPVQPAAEPKK